MRGSNPKQDHIGKLRRELDVATPESLGCTLSPRLGRARCREVWYHYYSRRMRRAVYRYLHYWLKSEDPEIRAATLKLKDELFKYVREEQRRKYAQKVRATKRLVPP